MLHALRSRQHVRTSHYTQIGRHKAHSRTRSLDVNLLRHVAHGINNHLRIITVAQVLGQLSATTERIDDKGTV